MNWRGFCLGLVLVTAIAVTASCDKGTAGPSGPDSGSLVIRLNKIPAEAGGILLAVQGGPVAGVSAVGGYDIWHHSAGGTNTTLLVRGALAPGPIAEFTVPDRTSMYTVTILDAAVGQVGGYERRVPQDFELVVVRP
jgi:hypothetical protein